MITTGTKTKFDEVSLEFDVKEDNTDVRIGIYPSADGSFNTDTEPLIMGPWFKADNFNLTLIGRRIDVRWKMECENTGTIILPFDAEVPADLEIHSIMTSEPSATPGDNNFYYIDMIRLDKLVFVSAVMIEEADVALCVCMEVMVCFLCGAFYESAGQQTVGISVITNTSLSSLIMSIYPPVTLKE